jgi:two-component system, OmpR family, sensor kinase
MSSNPGTDTGRSPPARGWLAGRSLRTRLLITMLVLLGLSCVVVGASVQIWLRSFLIGQIDERLTAAAFRTENAHRGPPPEQGQPPLFPAGQGSGTLSARIVDGRVVAAAILDAGGSSQELPAAAYPILTGLPVDRGSHTRDIGELGDYRLQAQPTPDGDILITGLPLSEVDDTLANVALVELGVAGAGMLIAGLAGAVIVRRTLRPLHRVAATASRVAELPLDRGEVALSVRVPDVDTDTRTEVGQVGAALNTMLRHVAGALRARQASEMRVRQFVADASHELRTPLAAIRGYAELARRFGDDVPADVGHALRRVESESARMTSMVEDLLLLARLDSGPPLDRSPVDVSQLAIDAISDAHVAGPHHHWQLDLPEDPVLVPGDQARLHQVLANLLANARVHTPAGTTVRLSLQRADDSVTLRVADDGSGIPPALVPDVFDRFARADNSRSRAAGSTGLGLAIVAAVVQAHGGQVGVASRPGRTAFTVTLPACQPDLDRPASQELAPAPEPAPALEPPDPDRAGGSQAAHGHGTSTA